MNKITKICIVIPYFGKWPRWIRYYLTSCIFNSSIDWMFFTDCGYPGLASDNLIFHQMTLHDINKLASSQLNLKIFIQNPYKLCDLKPAYGIIFQEYLKDYDFWGYGDIDLVYGNIRHFITEEVLSRFDFVTFHPKFIPGHLCMFRNNSIVNNIFKKCSNWQSVFQNEKMYSFAEIYNKKGIRIKSDIKAINKKRIYVDLFKTILYTSPFFKSFFSKVKHFINKYKTERSVCYDFSSIIKYAENINEINVFRNKLYIDDIELIKNMVGKWKIQWENGRLYYENKELIYFHFQFFKFSKKLEFSNNIETSASFRIIKN